MLSVGAAVAVPAVIGDVDQHLRSVAGELANFIREDGFIADENSEFDTTSVQGFARGACVEITDFFCQAAGKREHLLKRQILAEGDEMYLVVTRNPISLGTD